MSLECFVLFGWLVSASHSTRYKGVCSPASHLLFTAFFSIHQWLLSLLCLQLCSCCQMKLVLEVSQQSSFKMIAKVREIILCSTESKGHQSELLSKYLKMLGSFAICIWFIVAYWLQLPIHPQKPKAWGTVLMLPFQKGNSQVFEKANSTPSKWETAVRRCMS